MGERIQIDAGDGGGDELEFGAPGGVEQDAEAVVFHCKVGQQAQLRARPGQVLA